MKTIHVLAFAAITACGGGSKKPATVDNTSRTEAKPQGDLCGALQQIIAAAPGAFESIKAGEGDAPYGVGADPTTVSLPGSTCEIDHAGGSSDSVSCEMATGTDEASMEASFTQTRDAVTACLSSWHAEPGEHRVDLTTDTDPSVSVSLDSDLAGTYYVRVNVLERGEDYEAPEE